MSTKISWATETWNPIVGCEEISPGCEKCYAKNLAQSARLQQFSQYRKARAWDGTIVFAESQLLKPFGWKKPQLVFPSMSDPGHHNVKRDELDQIFAVIAIASEHQFQLLSKRPKAIKRYIKALTADRLYEASQNFWHEHQIPKRLWQPLPLLRRYFDNLQFPLKNLWIGTSVENQDVADRILAVKDTSAQIKFISCEPLLQRVDLRKYLGICVGCQTCEFRGDHRIGISMVDWVICGGESARKASDARVCHLDWLRSIVNQCQIAQVPVSVKQLGSNPIDSIEYIQGVAMTTYQVKVKNHTDINEFPQDLRFRQHPVF